MLEAPPTIRPPRPDELPNNPEVFERLKKRENTNFVEGFKLNYNATQELPFKFYAEINIDNSRLWQLFTTLVNLLPDRLSCIYNLYEEKPIYSIYTDKKSILRQLANYRTELTQDCFLEFGLISQTHERLEEVFVPESKYIKCWGNNEVSFRQLMNDFRLEEIPDMNFFDEFPKVVEPLTMFNVNVKSPEIVIEELKSFLKPKNKWWQFW